MCEGHHHCRVETWRRSGPVLAEGPMAHGHVAEHNLATLQSVQPRSAVQGRPAATIVALGPMLPGSTRRLGRVGSHSACAAIGHFVSSTIQVCANPCQIHTPGICSAAQLADQSPRLVPLCWGLADEDADGQFVPLVSLNRCPRSVPCAITQSMVAMLYRYSHMLSGGVVNPY